MLSPIPLTVWDSGVLTRSSASRPQGRFFLLSSHLKILFPPDFCVGRNGPWLSTLSAGQSQRGEWMNGWMNGYTDGWTSGQRQRRASLQTWVPLLQSRSLYPQARRGSWFPLCHNLSVGILGPQDRTGFQREPLGREGPVITPGPLALASGLLWGP